MLICRIFQSHWKCGTLWWFSAWSYLETALETCTALASIGGKLMVSGQVRVKGWRAEISTKAQDWRRAWYLSRGGKNAPPPFSAVIKSIKHMFASSSFKNIWVRDFNCHIESWICSTHINFLLISFLIFSEIIHTLCLAFYLVYFLFFLLYF